MQQLTQDRLTRAALAFGSLTIMMPLICAGFTTMMVPYSLMASVLGFLMLPMSVLGGLLMWQGLALEDFVHDVFCVLFLDKFHAVRRDYDPNAGLSALAFVPAAGAICGTFGFLAALFSERQPVASAGFYATIGIIYGILLFAVVTYWVVPLLARARAQ
jgi:hypothetical protein